MTQVMAKMTEAVSERSDGNGDATRQLKAVQKQLEMKSQELRTAKQERDEAQFKLDELQSSGAYFKDKYREAQDELRRKREEHSVAEAKVVALTARLESVQEESDDIKHSQLRVPGPDGGVEGERHFQEFQAQLQNKDAELRRLKATAANLERVNECLNKLTVLESEHRQLYERWCGKYGAITDDDMLRKAEAIKSQVQGVMSRLNAIVSSQPER